MLKFECKHDFWVSVNYITSVTRRNHAKCVHEDRGDSCSYNARRAKGPKKRPSVRVL